MARDNADMTSTTANGPQCQPGWQWAIPCRLDLGLVPRADAAAAAAGSYWVGYSGTAAQLLGFPDCRAASAWLATLAGNHIPAGSRPVSTVYSGHQFACGPDSWGRWKGDLAGRTDSPEAPDTQRRKFRSRARALQFFSPWRWRAVLRSSIREFRAAKPCMPWAFRPHAPCALWVRTNPVYREQPETAAVVTRLAPSFIRFGHFEHFSHHGLRRTAHPGRLRH